MNTKEPTYIIALVRYWFRQKERLTSEQYEVLCVLGRAVEGVAPQTHPRPTATRVPRKVRRRKNSSKPWMPTDDHALVELEKAGATIREMAAKLHRTIPAINDHLHRLRHKKILVKPKTPVVKPEAP